MIYVGVLLAIAIMSAIIFMAVDKKSTFIVRVASLIALGIMMLTIIICLIMVFTDNRVPVDESILIVGAPVEVKKEGGQNTWVLMMLIIVLIIIFVLIVILAMKESRKHILKPKQDSKGITAKFEL
jgi:ABC-type multidrug transport system fused ATPase/permease subunit